MWIHHEVHDEGHQTLTHDEPNQWYTNNTVVQGKAKAVIPQILNKPQSEVELALEMLVRAYDPCISCSTHYLKVNFKNL